MKRLILVLPLLLIFTGCGNTKTVTKTIRPKPNPAIYAIGDSITAGAQFADASDKAWPQVLAKQTGKPIINFGVGGACLVDQSCTIKDRYPELLKAHPSLIIIALGVNDMFHNETDTQIETAYQSLTDQANKAHIAFLIATIPPAQSDTTGPLPQIGRINTWISDTYTSKVLDFHGVLATPGTDILKIIYLNLDWIHPNIMGEQALADLVGSKLDH